MGSSLRLSSFRCLLLAGLAGAFLDLFLSGESGYGLLFVLRLVALAILLLSLFVV